MFNYPENCKTCGESVLDKMIVSVLSLTFVRNIFLSYNYFTKDALKRM
jgi:hypothetical protein